jgi:HK97 family phage major capsid protein
LQDAALLDTTLRQGFAEELSLRLDSSILSGTGAGQPLGYQNSACCIKVTRGSPGTIGITDIMNMFGRLLTGSYKNSVWVVNQDVLPTLYQLSISVGTAGVPVFLPGGSVSGVPFSTLLGRPLVVSEAASTLGELGDISFCDFSYYGIITKGSRTDVSMHLQFLQAEQVYRNLTRLDGQPLLSAPVVPFKGANSLSPFITLNA